MNWTIISITLAAFWLCLGVGILWFEYSTGKSLFGPGLLISPGWLCLVVAAYNVIRVVLSWKFSRRAEDEDDEPFRQRPVRAIDERNEDRG